MYVVKFVFSEKATQFEKIFFLLLTRVLCSMRATAYLSKSWQRFFKTNVDKSYYTNFTWFWISMPIVGPLNIINIWYCFRHQYISEWIYEVVVSPKIWTKNCKDLRPLVWHSTGQKSLQYLVHDFINPFWNLLTFNLSKVKYAWPSTAEFWQNLRRDHFKSSDLIKLYTKAQCL